MEKKIISAVIMLLSPVILALIMIILYGVKASLVGHEPFKHSLMAVNCRHDTISLIDEYVQQLCELSVNVSREIYLDHKLRKMSVILKAL